MTEHVHEYAPNFCGFCGAAKPVATAEPFDAGRFITTEFLPAQHIQVSLREWAEMKYPDVLNRDEQITQAIAHLQAAVTHPALAETREFSAIKPHLFQPIPAAPTVCSICGEPWEDHGALVTLTDEAP